MTAPIVEREGLTVIVPVQTLSAAGLGPGVPSAKITLAVPSSLAAVGLTAALATALPQAGIPANRLAGLHHDHPFVAWRRRDVALAVLSQA